MSYEDIISAVKSRPEIWQSRHPNFKKRLAEGQAWNELSEQLGIGGTLNLRYIKYFV